MAKLIQGLIKSLQHHDWWSRNWFYTALISIAIIGSFCAFCLPLLISEPFSAGDSVASLRHAILAATGGLLAMLTLWENRRKNLQEKEKNDLDHARQVKAERRSRYAKAIEQLADDKSTVRLGGIYTLAKLADEWLSDDKTLPDEDSRTEEAQIIVNSLCSYIRSPFPLAEKRELYKSIKDTSDYAGNFFADQFKLREEQEVRRTIFEEMSKRLSKISAVDRAIEIEKADGDTEYNQISKDFIVIPGTWSHLEYDFSHSQIFYSLNNLSLESPNFKNSTFYERACFASSRFAGNTNFNLAHFEGAIDFSNSIFSHKADFSNSNFYQGVNFLKTCFKESSFRSAIFKKKASFQWSIFIKMPSFYRSKFYGSADFLESIFENGAHFMESEFEIIDKNKDKVQFDGSFYGGESSFAGVTFRGPTFFNGAIFTNTTSFSKTRFISESDFHNSKSRKKFDAKARKETTGKLLFSQASFQYPAIHDFRVAEDSPNLINMGVADFTLCDGTTIRDSIPIDSYLFDPSSGETSEPAKPLDKSNDSEEEKPAE